MPRDSSVRLDDIREAIHRIQGYVVGMSQEQFAQDAKTVDAVIRCLEIIGEAVKALPAEVISKRPDIPWHRIAGLRDILIHEYFGVNLGIVWDVVNSKLGELQNAVDSI